MGAASSGSGARIRTDHSLAIHETKGNRYVVSNAAPGALVIASPGYLCALKPVRPDLNLVSWFDATPEAVDTASAITLIVDSNFMGAGVAFVFGQVLALPMFVLERRSNGRRPDAVWRGSS